MNYLLLMNYYFWSSRVCFLSTLARRINGLVYWWTIHCHESYDSLRIQKSSPIYIDLAIVYKQSPEKDIRVIKGNDIYVSLCSLKKAKFHIIFVMIKNQEYTDKKDCYSILRNNKKINGIKNKTKDENIKITCSTLLISFSLNFFNFDVQLFKRQVRSS